MGLLTPEERQKILKERGLALSRKCDYKECGKPIFSTLTYTGRQGHEYDTRACLEAAEPEMASIKPIPPKEKEKHTAMIEKKKKKKKREEESEDTDRKKKKKKRSDDDGDDVKKKKKKKKDREEKSSSSSSSKENPFREGSSIAKVFDMCRGGTSRAKISKFCESENIGEARIFHWMKKGEFGDAKWRFIEDDDGHIKIKMKS